MIDGLILGFVFGLIVGGVFSWKGFKEILDWQSNRIDFWFKSSSEWRDKYFELRYKKIGRKNG